MNASAEGRHWILPIARRAGLPADSAVSLRAGTDDFQAWSDVALAAGLSDADLARKIAEVYRLKVADLHDADPLARRLVPERTARRRGVFPLKHSDHDLVVATSNPIDPEIEQELELVSGRSPVFEIATPRDIAAAIDKHYPHANGEPRRKGGAAARVLLADDDVVARTMAKALLEKNGYTVVEAVDGLAALGRLVDGDIQLVLLDQEMPVMSGIEVLRRIRRDRDTTSLPVVMLCVTDELEALEAGADDYLRKPFAPARFLARLRAALLRAG